MLREMKQRMKAVAGTIVQSNGGKEIEVSVLARKGRRSLQGIICDEMQDDRERRRAGKENNRDCI